MNTSQFVIIIIISARLLLFVGWDYNKGNILLAAAY